MKKVFILFISLIMLGLALFLAGSITFGLNYSEPDYEESLILENEDFSPHGDREYIALYDAHTIGDPARIHITSEGNDSIPVRFLVNNPSPFQQIDRQRTTPVNETFETVNSPSGNYQFIIKVEDTNHTIQDLEIEIYHFESIPDSDPVLILSALSCICGIGSIPIGLMCLLVSLMIEFKNNDPKGDQGDLNFEDHQQSSYKYIIPPREYENR